MVDWAQNTKYLYLRGRDVNTDRPTDSDSFLLMDTSRVLYLQDYKNIYLPVTTRRRRKDGQTNRQWLFLTKGHFESLISKRT